MHILMTGATGSIGRPLTITLLKQGYRLTIVTRKEQIADPDFAGSASILKADIRDLAALEAACKLDRVDAFIHLAANLDYFGNQRELTDINVKGTANLLGVAKRLYVKKFIFISSIEAMGMVRPKDIPADENHCTEPVSNYGRSKLEAERFALTFSEWNNIDVIVLRVGNVYGPHNPSFIVPLANACLSHNDLYSFFPCYKERYVHPVFITDVIQGITRAITKTASGRVFIISGQQYVTLEHIMNIIIRCIHITGDALLECGVKERIYLNLRDAIRRFNGRADILAYFTAGRSPVVHRAYSIERAKRELGYAPTVMLEDGIAKTLAWAREEGILKG